MTSPLYVNGQAPLPGARNDLYPVPGDTSRFWDAGSINMLRQALAELLVQARQVAVATNYGLLCDGTTDDHDALAAMIAALGSQGMTVVIPGPCKVGTNITIPSNLPVRFEGAGAFTGAGTVTYSALPTGANSMSTVTATGGGTHTLADWIGIYLATAASVTSEASTRAAADTSEANARAAADALLAPLASPAFSGTPTGLGPATVTATGAGAPHTLADHLATLPDSKVLGRSLAAHFGDVVNVKDAPYNAKGDGTTDDTSAINAALAVGGTVYLPGPAIYKISSGRLLVTVNNTTIRLAANVTILFSGWTYPGSQVPFGNAIHVTANDCAVLGEGPSSIIQITGGSQANGIGLLHKARLHISGLTIDGGKSGQTAIADDTFQSGISIIAASVSGATDKTEVTIDRVTVRNFAQYGIQFYGDLADGNTVRDCSVHDNGIAGQSLSVGGGFALTRAVRNTIISGCRIYGNKWAGIFGSSAGLASTGLVFSGNTLTGNGLGIRYTEEAQWGCVAGVGTTLLTIAGNTITGSTTGSGIQVGTYDNVGFLRNVSIAGNVVTNSAQYGLLIQTNATLDATHGTTNLAAAGNVLSANSQYGLALGSGLDSTTSLVSNVIKGNVVGDVTNSSPAAPVISFASGSLTLGIAGSSTAGSATYSAQSGSYTKVGDRVFFDAVIAWSAMTGTGTLRVTGFPYVPSSSGAQGIVWVVPNGITVSGQLTLLLSGGSTVSDVYVVDNASGSSVSMLAVPASGQLRICGSYHTDP